MNTLRNRTESVRCPPENLTSVYERVVVDARSFVESWNGELYLVYLPIWTRYGAPEEACDYSGDILLHDGVIQLARSVGLPVIDLTEDFDNLPDPLVAWPYGLNGHYSEEGYRLVANRVLSELNALEKLRGR